MAKLEFLKNSILKNAETGEDLCMICAKWVQK